MCVFVKINLEPILSGWKRCTNMNLLYGLKMNQMYQMLTPGDDVFAFQNKQNVDENKLVA